MACEPLWAGMIAEGVDEMFAELSTQHFNSICALSIADRQIKHCLSHRVPTLSQIFIYTLLW